MDWLDHDRLGFNYRLSEIACALGIAQLERLDGDARRARARPPSATARRWPGSRGSSCRARTRAATARGWFVFVVQLPRGVDRDEVVRALRGAAIQSKPYLPAIHLMSFYRERFGHREGEFPVCEDVAARSLALPFFPQITEAQIERVAERLRRSSPGSGGRAAIHCARVALLRAPGPRLPGDERLDRLRPRGCGRTTSRSRARTRGCSRRGGIIGEEDRERCWRGSTRSRAS